jgi:hypothetical protein
MIALPSLAIEYLPAENTLTAHDKYMVCCVAYYELTATKVREER